MSGQSGKAERSSDDGGSHHGGRPTASPPPSLSTFINLSDYMYYADIPNSFTSAFASDIGFSPLLTSSGTPVQSVINKDGFYAEAFGSNLSAAGGVTASSQVVIAYEGTNLLGQSGTFRGGQAIDNAYIFAGGQPPSAADSKAFANRVLNLVTPTVAKSDVFLTGHSLGAADAEYAAQATALSGVTFAAPGVAPLAKQPSSNLTNYVDYNDPIGNYANDGTGSNPGQNPYGNLLTSQSIAHYGAPTITGVNDVADSDVTDFVYYLNQGDYKTAGSYLLDGLSYHPLSNYASDLDLTLYLADGSKGADAGFFASSLAAAAGGSSASVDPSYVGASMTGGGMAASTTHAHASHADSAFAADTQHVHGGKGHLG